WQPDYELLVESFIPGRELTVAVLGIKGESARALTVTELKPSVEFYDYTAKYTDGVTQHIIPAQIPDDIAALAMRWAVAAHEVMGCSGSSRSDFRWDDTKGKEGLYWLEVNTQPGMIALSLVSEQAI